MRTKVPFDRLSSYIKFAETFLKILNKTEFCQFEESTRLNLCIKQSLGYACEIESLEDVMENKAPASSRKRTVECSNDPWKDARYFTVIYF